VKANRLLETTMTLLNFVLLLPWASFWRRARPKRRGRFSDSRPKLVVQLGHSSTVASLALTADGRYVATGSFDKTAKLWEVESGKEIRTFSGHSDAVCSVVLGADGMYLATGGEDATTRIWNLQDGVELCQLVSFRDSTWVVVDPEGHFDTNDLEEIKGLHWIMPDDPMKPLPLKMFLRDYYEPRLLPRILRGEKFNTRIRHSDLA